MPYTTHVISAPRRVGLLYNLTEPLEVRLIENPMLPPASRLWMEYRSASGLTFSASGFCPKECERRLLRYVAALLTTVTHALPGLADPPTDLLRLRDDLEEILTYSLQV